MAIPQVEIHLSDTLQKAEERVERAFEGEGIELVAFENLNQALPCCDSCHFFHAEVEGAPYVVVVNAEPWIEETVITVLNVLLELRVDPDPPGSRLFVRFFSGEAVPDVLELLFGDTDVADLECRAALVARFGHEIEPNDAPQLAAAARYLVRAQLDVEIDPSDESADRALADLICSRLRVEGLPGEPLNLLILLGCLYGEALRFRLGGKSRWLTIPQFDPWPGLLFEPSSEQAESSPSDSEGEKGDRGGFAFNPVAHVIHLWQSGDVDALTRATRELLGRER